VIFIDECDAVFGRRGSVNTDAGTEESGAGISCVVDGVASEGQIWVWMLPINARTLDDAIVI